MNEKIKEKKEKRKRKRKTRTKPPKNGMVETGLEPVTPGA
jgi:hypothetical protein